MTNKNFSNDSFKVTIPAIPKIMINTTEIFGGTSSGNENNIIFQLKQANAADWPVSYLLAKGEPGFELDTGKLKIGDGHTVWSELNYISGHVNLSPDDALEYYENNILLKGQYDAQTGQVPTKAEDGAITWVTPVDQDQIDELASRITTLENGAIINIASDQDAGIVKSSNNIDKISVAADGTMSINAVGVNKLVNNGYTLILNNGQS